MPDTEERTKTEMKPVRILTVGSANMDMVLRMNRVPAAGETVLDPDGSLLHIPGGKGANCAVAVAKLGAESLFCARLGADTNGKNLYDTYVDYHVNTDYIKVDKTVNTGMAAIFVEANGANRIVVYPGANRTLVPQDAVEAIATKPDALCLQFETPFETTLECAKMAYARGIPVILDAAPADRSIPLSEFPMLEIFSPNESETELYTGIVPTGAESCMRAALALSRMVKAKYYVLKLGARGAFIFDGRLCHMVPSYQVPARDTTAAGDAFTAALAVAYSENGRSNILSAVKFANAVGALTVTRCGASRSIPTREETDRFLSEQGGF